MSAIVQLWSAGSASLKAPWPSLLLLLGIIPFASAEQAVPDKTPAKITYEEHVKPIFRQHCLSCHSQGDSKGGLALDSYAALMEGGGSGEVVYDDGEVEGSRLWQLVSHEDTPIMPPNQDRIPDDQLSVMRKWLEGGSLEDSGSKATVKKQNALAFVAVKSGKPDGPAAMPQTTPLIPVAVTERPAATTAIACSPWAPLVAIAGQRQILLYDLESTELAGILPFAEGVAQSLRFSRDGAYLIAGGGAHAVRGIVAIYDVRTGERVATVGDELDVVIDADASSNLKRVALGGPRRLLRVYDAGNDQVVFETKKHTDWILAVAYSPDDVLIASADRSAGLIVWEADTGREYLNLTGHKDAVHAVAWRDDGNVLASGSSDGTVRLWDMFTGKQLKSINVGTPVYDVAFDHQGRLVTAGGNGVVAVWKSDGGKLREFPKMDESVLDVAFSHDGQKVVYGDWSGQTLSRVIESPESVQSLPSNPPSQEELRQRFGELRDQAKHELNPLSDQHEELASTVRSTRAAFQDKQAERDRLAKVADEAEQKAEQIGEQLTELTKQVSAAEARSRVLQDEWVAARVGVRNEEKPESHLAAAERSLGNQLIQLAERRGRQPDLRDQRRVATQTAESSRSRARVLHDELAAMQRKLDGLSESLNDLATLRDAAQQRVARYDGRLQRLRKSTK